MKSTDDFYLKAVTDLGDSSTITASEDIYSESGLKLVTAGFRINSKLYDRLVNHRLKKPLDMSLSSDPSLTASSVHQDLAELVKDNALLAQMKRTVEEAIKPYDLFSEIRIPPALLFKLNVAKQKFPKIYTRSLACSLCSTYLGVMEQVTTPMEVHTIAQAGLLHNIGLMHVNPDLLLPGHVMNQKERRHLYAHPLTAYLLLKEFEEIPTEAANAVLEQHERSDGRGYPRGISGQEISRIGEILGLSVVALDSLLSYLAPARLKRFEVMLKLNDRIYGIGLTAHFLNLTKQFPPTQLSPSDDQETLQNQIAVISQAVAVLTDLDKEPETQLSEYAIHRYTMLRHDMLKAGIDLDEGASLVEELLDQELRSELIPILHEAIWQLKSIVSDIARKWRDQVEEVAPTTNKNLIWYRNLKDILKES